MKTPDQLIKEEKLPLFDTTRYKCTECFESFHSRYEAEFHAKMHVEKLDFEDWKERQNIEYKLVVSVNDYEVYNSTYRDLEDLYGEGRKPEGSVEQQLTSDYDEYAESFEDENE